MMQQKTFDTLFALLKTYVRDLPTPVVELIQIQTNDVFKVLLTTILSARTKDETTAHVSKQLFKKIRTINDLKHISEEQLRELIYPVGFYKTKAKHLKALPVVLEEQFDGRIPGTIEELLLLPGVGRKTANLVVAVGFNKPAICVDTHVHRIMNRFDYVRTNTPFATEMALRKKLPVNYWLDINWMLVSFGQHHCTPLRPRCSTCIIARLCKKRGVTASR